MISKTGRYKVFPIVGTAVMAAGLYLLSTMRVGTPKLESSLYMVLVGAGMGLIIQVMIIAVQNAVPHRDLGTATGAETFMRSMGGAFGVAVSGALLSNRLAYWLPRLLPAGTRVDANANTLAASPKAIDGLPPAVKHAVVTALAHGIHAVFLYAVPLTLLAFLGTWLLKEKPLRATAHIGVAEAGIEAGLAFETTVVPESAPDLVGGSEERR
jgi:hypothetical protein